MKQREDGVVIYENVILGKDVVLEGPCIIGKPPRGRNPGELRLTIGDGAHIRPFSTIYAGSSIGASFQTGQGASVREDNLLGDNVKVGTNAVLEHGNRVGDNVSIHTGCFLELTHIEDDVFIGPNVVFVDCPHPPCPDYANCRQGPTIKRGAKIGANSTILPGVVVGEKTLVGAGAVVTSDLPEAVVAVGNPAKIAKNIDELECTTGAFAKPYSWDTK